jgi:hypothetical protein
MANFTRLQNNAHTSAPAARTPANCFGYWLETNTVGKSSNSIEQDPMQTASFYKESGN